MNSPKVKCYKGPETSLLLLCYFFRPLFKSSHSPADKCQSILTSPLWFIPLLFLSFSYFLKKCLFIFGCAGLQCCTWTFSSCGKQGLLELWCVGFSCCRAQVQEQTDSVAEVHGLSCTGLCGIFLDQGSTPWTLQWQVDS